MSGGVLLNKDAVWRKLNYRPNRAQAIVHRWKARNQVIAAGRRTGKSTANGHELVPEALRVKRNLRQYEDSGLRAEYWCIGPQYSDSEKEFRVFWNDCKRLGIPFDKPGSYYSAEAGNMIVSLWEGKFMFQAKSAMHPETLVGEGLHGVIMAEAAKMKKSVWTKFARPMLADFQGWSRFASTPEGRNWFYELYLQGLDPHRLDWCAARFPSWYNENVFRKPTVQADVNRAKEIFREEKRIPLPLRSQLQVDDEIIAMLLDSGELTFSQEVEAKFGQYVGRVFADWDEETHGRPLKYDPDLPVYLATDYGWTNPFVVLFIQVNVFDDVFVVGEYYETHKTDEDVAREILNDSYLGPLARKARFLFPDPEDPKASNQLARKWQVQIRQDTGGRLKNRLTLIRTWLKEVNLHLPEDHPERRPKLFVDPRRCPNLCREMDSYRYPAGSENRPNPEEPLDKDNHAPEALGRFFAGMWLKQASDAPRSSQAAYAR